MAKKIDTLEPVNIEMLGTENDPCFGKHYDPRCAECSRCGDNEICAIVMAQKNTLKRAALEAEQEFKDIQPEVMADKKLVRKKVKKRIRELIRMAGKKGITPEDVIDDVHVTYVVHGYTKAKVKKVLDYVVEHSDTIILTNNKLKRKSNGTH
jgi:hypothetical protein